MIDGDDAGGNKCFEGSVNSFESACGDTSDASKNGGVPAYHAVSYFPLCKCAVADCHYLHERREVTCETWNKRDKLRLLLAGLCDAFHRGRYYIISFSV